MNIIEVVFITYCNDIQANNPYNVRQVKNNNPARYEPTHFFSATSKGRYKSGKHDHDVEAVTPFKNIKNCFVRTL